MKNEHWYQKKLTQEQLEVFIKDAHTGKNNDKAFIGTIGWETVQKIESMCGKKVGKIMIESAGIRHSYKKANHNLKNECLEICNDIDGKITFVMEIRKHYGGWLTLVTCYRLNRGGATL